MMMNRPTWDEYYINMLDAVSLRSTCDRGKCAAIITKDNHILSTGYAGSPPGSPHCDEAGHMLKKVTHGDGTTTEHCKRTIHAEKNAIFHCNVSMGGATIYIKMEPCYDCAMAISAVGIKRVVCAKRYHKAEESRELLQMANIVIITLSHDEEEYE